MLGAVIATALTAASAPSPCELHLFALDLGAGPPPQGNALIRVEQPSNDPLAFINVMSPQDRLAEIDDADYRRALNLADGTAIVRHWDIPVDARVKKSTTPLVPTPGRCHTELAGYYAMGMMASRSRTGKNEFSISLSLREFDADGHIVFAVAKSGNGAVDTEKKVGRQAALLSLQGASVAMIEDFGKQVGKQRDKSLRK